MLFAINYVTNNYMAEQYVVPAKGCGLQSLQGQWRWLLVRGALCGG